MTWDDAVAKFFPGLTFSALVDVLVHKGWNDKFAQYEALRIGRLGFDGKTPYANLEENVRAYGVSTTAVIRAVCGDDETVVRVEL